MWYFVRQGDEITQKEQCIETLGMKAKVDVDPDMRSALTSEDGLLRPGALPKVAGASAGGSKVLLQAITTGVAAPKKKKKEEQEQAQEVEPQTWAEKAQTLLPDMLKEACEARKLSIKLGGLEFAQELSKDLLSHAGQLEQSYKKLAAKVGEGNEKALKAYVNSANDLIAKGSKAQARKTPNAHKDFDTLLLQLFSFLFSNSSSSFPSLLFSNQLSFFQISSPSTIVQNIVLSSY